MNSLRVQLMIWIAALYAVSAGVALFVSYRQYETSISHFMDGQMHALALSYVHQITTTGRPPQLKPPTERNIQHHGAAIVQFWSADGALLTAPQQTPGLKLQAVDGFHTVGSGSQSWRVYTAHSSPVRVQVITSNTFRRRVIWDSAWLSAKPILLLLPVTIALIWSAVYWVFRPLGRLVGTISAQNERTLAPLADAHVPRELLPLVRSLNDLLKRLRSAFESQSHFIQDAAHELRTPLTALKLQANNLRHQAGSGAAGELAQLEAGIQRLQRVVEQLLQLARQESLPSACVAGAIELRAVVEESVKDLIPLAEDRAIDLGLSEIEAVKMHVDAQQLRLVLDNLLHNAVRYTPAGGRVDVGLRQLDGAAVVEIADTGPGIPAAQLDRVFDRFFRIPAPGVEGSGLGLAIARSAASRCGASLDLANRAHGTGLVARLRIPLA